MGEIIIVGLNLGMTRIEMGVDFLLNNAPLPYRNDFIGEDGSFSRYYNGFTMDWNYYFLKNDIWVR